MAQYYVFVRLGREGFRIVQQESRDVATWLAAEIERLGPFRLLTRGDQLPVFALTTRPEVRASTSSTCRGGCASGLARPGIHLPRERTDLAVLRVVCRNGLSRDLAGLLVEDLERALPDLERQDGPQQRAAEATAFHH